MKKLAVALILAAFITPVMADIQAPPISKQTPTHKLGRGIANIIYGFTEIPTSIYRSAEVGDPVMEVWTSSVLRGFKRTGQRFGYGVYEVINWRKPLYKETFRPPYESLRYDPVNGFEEFPPQIGNLSTLSYTRGRTW